MIVSHLNVIGVSAFPGEAHPKLAVDPNRMLASPISHQRVELVAGRESQVFDSTRPVHHTQLAPRDPHEIGWKAFGAFAVEH
jgi:hypothetical protein